MKVCVIKIKSKCGTFCGFDIAIPFCGRLASKCVRL